MSDNGEPVIEPNSLPASLLAGPPSGLINDATEFWNLTTLSSSTTLSVGPSTVSTPDIGLNSDELQPQSRTTSLVEIVATVVSNTVPALPILSSSLSLSSAAKPSAITTAVNEPLQPWSPTSLSSTAVLGYVELDELSDVETVYSVQVCKSSAFVTTASAEQTVKLMQARSLIQTRGSRSLVF